MNHLPFVKGGPFNGAETAESTAQSILTTYLTLGGSQIDLGIGDLGGDGGSLAGSLGVLIDLGSPSLSGDSEVGGEAGVLVGLDGEVGAGSDASGEMAVLLSIGGEVLASATVSASLSGQVSLAGDIAGSAIPTGSAAVGLSLSGISAGVASLSAELETPIQMSLSGTVSGSASLRAHLRIQVQVAAARATPLHQRIYNALRALVEEGPFHPCTVDQRTGQMTVDTSRQIKPVGVTVVNLTSHFAPAASYRRNMASERSEWVWEVRIEFPGHSSVSFEAWEDSLIDRDIQIPDVVGGGTSRSLLARLREANYNPTPEASPNRGPVASFLFEINPISLRK